MSVLPDRMICPKSIKFTAQNTNGKMRNYMMIFNTALNSILPLDIPTSCILYKITTCKNRTKYTQISSQDFVVRQNRDIGLLNNEMLTGNFSNIILPNILDIQNFITDALPGQTFSSLQSTTIIDSSGNSII